MFIIATVFNNKIKMINFTETNLKVGHFLKERKICVHRKGIFHL